MSDLYDLFDAASDGLPPLPDLAPAARRIARRRQLAARTTAAVLSSALVIGAGTFALSAQRSGTSVGGASRTPQSYSGQYVLDTLRSLWPIRGQHLALTAGGYGIDIMQGDHMVGRMFFEVNLDADKFPSMLKCNYGSPGGDCVSAKSSDGDAVLAEFRPAGAEPGPVTAGSLHTFPSATATAIGTPGLTLSAQKNGFGRAYRLHGTHLGQLTMMGSTDAMPTNGQLLALVESASYEQLIESAAAADSFQWLGTPPAGIPSYTYGPSPSGPAASATPDSSAGRN